MSLPKPLVALFCVLSFSTLILAQSSSKPCALPQHRQLDFWIGDWDAFDIGNPKPAARARITGILDGCVIHEDYQQNDGLKGQSFSTYDESRGVWHQTWVTNRGQLLVVEGKFEDGALRLAGEYPAKKALVRVFWKSIPGGVHEKAEISTDRGKTWTTWFDMEFHPHKS